MFTRKGKIYTLAGPDGVPFYVGCTIATMESRLKQHLSEAAMKWKQGAKVKMIRELNYDITATIVTIVDVTGSDYKSMQNKLRPLEKDLIKKMVSEGIALTNREAREHRAHETECEGMQVRVEAPKSVKLLKIA